MEQTGREESFVVQSTEQALALLAILTERTRQDRLWGDRNQHGRGRLLAILTEEVGEVARAILNGNKHNYRQEVIQVAAVATMMLEVAYRELDEEACEEGGQDVGMADVKLLTKPAEREKLQHLADRASRASAGTYFMAEGEFRRGATPNMLQRLLCDFRELELLIRQTREAISVPNAGRGPIEDAAGTVEEVREVVTAGEPAEPPERDGATAGLPALGTEVLQALEVVVNPNCPNDPNTW